MNDEIKHHLIHAKEHMEDAEAQCKNKPTLKKKIRGLINQLQEITEGEQ